MLHHINGKVSEIEANLAVIDCHGIGFGLNITTNTASRLKIGETALLYVYENVKEDAYDLFGFAEKRERRCFEMLLGVSGVGPKAALSILSATTPESFAMAIISGDEKAITLAPGVGKKIAQRVILELKDKISKETGEAYAGSIPAASGSVGVSKMSDAASALAVLGYGSSEISVALKDIDIENNALEDIVRMALKKMIK